MFAFVGDNVLDPFLGSGTTSLAARNLGRNSIGYEINPEFIPYIKRKLMVEQQDISNTTYKFITQEKIKEDFSEAIKKLPYIFHDPHRFDKKIDPKKLQFGSKIDKNSKERECYYSIKEIISPERMRLNNDLVVRLIGVKQNKDLNSLAIEFLKKKTRRQKVFLKYDSLKHDKDNNLLCYLYLKNKTFLNAHLIKNGFVDVDTSYDYKHLIKFSRLRKEQGND